jgi:hypothetical protein
MEVTGVWKLSPYSANAAGTVNHRLEPRIRRDTTPGSRLTKVIDMPISHNDVYIKSF